MTKNKITCNIEKVIILKTPIKCQHLLFNNAEKKFKKFV